MSFKKFSAVSLFCSLLLCSASGHAISREQWATGLKKKGLSVVACPRYVANTRTGLFSGINQAQTLCVGPASRDQLKKAVGGIKFKRFPLDGRFDMGSAFSEVIEQEGDVQTNPCRIGNYPAIVHFQMLNDPSYKVSSTVGVRNFADNKTLYNFEHGRGNQDVESAVNQQGDYYFKVNAYPDPKEPTQPLFQMTMEFMEPYEGYPVTAADMKDARMKPLACPSYLLDLNFGKVYPLAKNYVCTRRFDPIDAGFTPAPFNLGSGLFMSIDPDIDSYGDWTSLPFRISGPTPITYTVDDPADGKGEFNLYLMDLATGRRVTQLVNVRGSIANTTTFINTPGDYYFYARSDSYEPQENGDIQFTISFTSGY
jgi:hypothetical protein